MKRQKLYLGIVFLFVFIFTANAASAYYPTSIPWLMDRNDVTRTGTTTSTAPNTNTTLWIYSYSGSLSTPIVVDGKVIFCLSTKVYAVDETTGVKLWESASLTSILSTPTYSGGMIYAASSGGYVYCLDAVTGTKLWEYDARPGQIHTDAIVSAGKVFFAISDASGNYLYALNASNGLYKWSYSTTAAIYSSPAIDGDLLYFGCDDNKIYALNHTGSLPALKWYNVTKGPVKGTPTVAYGMLFFGSGQADHSIFAFNATTGVLIWKYDFSVGQYAVNNPLAVYNGIIYCAPYSGNKVVALYANATQFQNYTENDPTIKLWSTTLDSYYPSGPIYADGKIFVSDHGKLIALDVSDGHVVWKYTFPYFEGDPVIADGRLFVSHSNDMYCFGDFYPPVTYHYAVNAGGQDWDVMLVINATASQFDTTGLLTLKKITYKLEGIPLTTGMSSITIPNGLLGGPYTVSIDGGAPLNPPDVHDNGDNTTTISFAYYHSVHTVAITGTTVLPEFPQTNVLTILMLAATVVGCYALYFKRNKKRMLQI